MQMICAAMQMYGVSAAMHLHGSAHMASRWLKMLAVPKYFWFNNAVVFIKMWQTLTFTFSTAAAPLHRHTVQIRWSARPDKGPIQRRST